MTTTVTTMTMTMAMAIIATTAKTVIVVFNNRYDDLPYFSYLPNIIVKNTADI